MEKLAYTKKILSNVAFDQELFLKEFRKASRSLPSDMRDELKSWCVDQFGLVIFRNSYSTSVLDG